MKIKISKTNGEIIDLESTMYPLFEGGFVRFIIEGTFMDIKKAQWYRIDNISSMEMIND